jgi:hypothetical protein
VVIVYHIAREVYFMKNVTKKLLLMLVLFLMATACSSSSDTADNDTDNDTETDTETDTGTDTETDVIADTENDTDEIADTDSSADSDTGTDSDTSVDTDSSADSDTGTDSDTATDSAGGNPVTISGVISTLAKDDDGTGLLCLYMSASTCEAFDQAAIKGIGNVPDTSVSEGVTAPYSINVQGLPVDDYAMAAVLFVDPDVSDCFSQQPGLADMKGCQNFNVSQGNQPPASVDVSITTIVAP